MTSDLRTSLEREKQRSHDLLPALEHERNRTIELSSEIAALSEKNREGLNASNNEIDSLR